jgi:hypothetical protein
VDIALRRKIILNGADKNLAPAKGLVWSAGLGGMLWGLTLVGLWLAGLL